MGESIVSIIDAPIGMKAVFDHEFKGLYEANVICIGLTNTGFVGLMVAADDGHIVFIDEVQAQLVGVHFGEETITDLR
ncbi:hypothetical protein J2R98_002318 [Alkalibacillus filiformis]|uniref:Uncharacterized protein n=1 Tax=Alkalibacillus filiformis TaxID=200990 RepID=A0ABU0DVJ2_9BACI|nr:hypothetical protein [Alkalibacillus filiformis]MDQ0352474.1 hypothetical protein [Alkalibacillus filiformis]